MTTLVRLGLALQLLDAGQHTEAVEQLESIVAQPNSTDVEQPFRIVPRELVLLLLGNAIGRQACDPGGICDDQALNGLRGPIRVPSTKRQVSPVARLVLPKWPYSADRAETAGRVRSMKANWREPKRSTTKSSMI